jgi:DNA-directed RNA polymerase specialized sigma subunit
MLSLEQQSIIENSIWVVNTALKKQGLQKDEDLRQSAILYMCECLERFDTSKNVAWTTFAYKNVYLYIKRTASKQKLKSAAVVECDIFDIPEAMVSPAEKSVAQETSEELINKIKSRCTKDEIKVIELKLQGYKGFEISEIMGWSTRKTNIFIKSIKEKAGGLKNEKRNGL